MTTKIGINGFGRIGRQVLKAIKEFHADELEVVAVNDLFPADVNAHLLKYDSNFGRYEGTVEAKDGGIEVDGKFIKVFAERDPRNIPWSELRCRHRDRINRCVSVMLPKTPVLGLTSKVVAQRKSSFLLPLPTKILP